MGNDEEKKNVIQIVGEGELEMDRGVGEEAVAGPDPILEGIPWRGGKCRDCYFWVREGRQLPPGQGVCLESPPGGGVVLMPHQQPAMLKARLEMRQGMIPMTVMFERQTNQDQGCGRFKHRKGV